MASAASMASNEEDGPEEAMNLVVAKSPVVDGEAIDEEEAEALEVTKLLSGGIMETQFGDLMMATSGRTPTPPMEDTGKLLFKKNVVIDLNKNLADTCNFGKKINFSVKSMSR